MSDNSKDWPSLTLAFEFVRPSYEFAMRRLEAVEGRLQNVITVALGFVVAVPVIAKALHEGISFRSNCFYAALGIGTLILLVGMAFKVWGSLQILDPAIFEKDPWRSYSEGEFKQEAIYWAGQALERNSRLVNLKGNIASLLTLLLGAQVAFMLVWLVTSL